MLFYIIIVIPPFRLAAKLLLFYDIRKKKSLKINLESSKIKFKDRNPETGSNDYDTEKKIITVKVSNKGYYKFKINEENKNLCIYTELDKCIVEFHKK